MVAKAPHMAGIRDSAASDIMVETATVIGMVLGSGGRGGGCEGSEVGVDGRSAALWLPPPSPRQHYTLRGPETDTVGANYSFFLRMSVTNEGAQWHNTLGVLKSENPMSS